MKYGTIYRINWNTVETVVSASLTTPSRAVQISIFDTENLIPDDEDPEIIQLLAGPRPLIISVINNEEDKFSPIRAKQAVIQFVSDINQFEDVTTFSDSPDNRWYVEITADEEFIFKGFLMLADSQQDFLPDPNIVVLTASDHLGVLKDINLTTNGGQNPQGKYRIAELIALCLKKTGLNLPINVINNLRHGSGSILVDGSSTGFNATNNSILLGGSYAPFFYRGQQITVSGTASNDGTYTVLAVGVALITILIVDGPVTNETASDVTFTDASGAGHFYDKIYLDVKTFELEIGVSEYCYSVLEKILGEDCFLTQWKGEWYIMRMDEYDGNPIYEANFDADGNFVDFDDPQDFLRSIGAAEDVRFADADALLRFDRPNGFIKETFRFTYPAEILCNVSLARGALNESLSTDNYLAYDPECWVLQLNYPPDPPSSNGYIRVVEVNGYETERYLHIEAASTPSFLYFRNVDKIPLQVSDKFKFSVDWKYSSNVGGSGHYRIPVAQMRLYGEDGSRWSLNAVAGYGSSDPTTYWIESDVNWLSNNRYLYHEGEFDQDDLSGWQTASLETPPLPVGGVLEIFLVHNFYTDSKDKSFSSLSFEYIPFRVGTYSILTGHYNMITRNDGDSYLAKREREVYIQDALKPLDKGAMFFIGGSEDLFSGTLIMSDTSNTITLPFGSGYNNYLFYPGQKIALSGTNAGEYTISEVTYSLVGDQTIITVEEDITTVTESAAISVYTFFLTQKWYTSNVFALGPPPSIEYIHPYGYIQAYAVWNQYRNANRIFSTTLLGFGESGWPDLLDKIALTDNNANTNNRYFLLISFEQDWKSGKWRGTFIEDYRTDIGHVYSDQHEFKYTTKQNG
jgi:hypothetical protein